MDMMYGKVARASKKMGKQIAKDGHFQRVAIQKQFRIYYEISKNYVI